MKISYKFLDGKHTEVEVADAIGAVIVDSRRVENSAERKHRRYCYSIDAIKYEGKEYGTGEFADALCDDAEIRNKKIWDAFSHLSEVQKRRMMMLAAGLSIREIARREDKDIKTIRESIEAARKKFLKFY